ncbi:HlyD family secretion protein [Chitiniphilus eburneus]|uniref:HlyD family efflux transporter periplasmic adaptor subunit n=1 Tax=Chitiniphilus eburneus TaxID=2571148 RepID=A0A4U0PUC8_9NEIS|nr:HlyD family secretion protein [Chitiniphilus eburneus]TJZ72063.1 HlyD family efflux transporter periplasmic adaptor subunit [Chitiniphilus eburneus]
MPVSRLCWLPLLLLAGCSREAPTAYQGYVEGEFVALAASQSGRLTQLAVKRGQQVKTGAAVFALDTDNEVAARRQRQQQLAAAQAQLDDLRTGKRPQEIEVTQAQLAAAEAEARRAAQQRQRDEAQFQAGGVSQAQLEQSRAADLAAAANVLQLRRELDVARLPGRAAQMQAQAAQVEAARAALAQADWTLNQKALHAPAAALVFDTLYREGEWVAAGSPVVRLLPPGNIKVRFFVPQAALASLAPGREVTLGCDGCTAIPARIDYIATEAEYTPPVIYSNDTRDKLVFMVEARPAPAQAAGLHPGQPMTVTPR